MHVPRGNSISAPCCAPLIGNGQMSCPHFLWDIWCFVGKSSESTCGTCVKSRDLGSLHLSFKVHHADRALTADLETAGPVSPIEYKVLQKRGKKSETDIYHYHTGWCVIMASLKWQKKHISALVRSAFLIQGCFWWDGTVIELWVSLTLKRKQELPCHQHYPLKTAKYNTYTFGISFVDLCTYSF